MTSNPAPLYYVNHQTGPNGLPPQPFVMLSPRPPPAAMNFAPGQYASQPLSSQPASAGTQATQDQSGGTAAGTTVVSGIPVSVPIAYTPLPAGCSAGPSAAGVPQVAYFAVPGVAAGAAGPGLLPIPFAGHYSMPGAAAGTALPASPYPGPGPVTYDPSCLTS